MIDVKQNMKTNERMEGATADNEKCGDSSSARVGDKPMRSTRFGDQEPYHHLSLNPSRGYALLVDEDAQAPNPCE